MNRPVRLLFTTAEPHPTFRSDVKVLFGKYLPRNGVTSDLLGVTEVPVDQTPEWGGGQRLLRYGSSKFKLMLADVLQMLSLFRLCFKGYDALVVRDKPILGVIGLMAARLAGIHFVSWVSFPLPEAYLRLARLKDGSVGPARRLYTWLRGTLGYHLLYRVQVRRADWVFAQSDTMVVKLREKGMNHDRVCPVPMGVDMENLPPAIDPLPPELVGRRLGVYLGTLDRYREPEILVDTALRVSKIYPDFRLMIIGEADEPSDKGWLKAYAVEKGATDWVYLTGRVNQAVGLGLARHAEVGLSPFLRSELLEDASPTKAVEYLALNVPVVCNDQPDQAKVINESDGGWCVPLTPESFADAVVECLRSPEQSKAMATKGHGYVRDHRSYDKLGHYVAQHFSDLVGQDRPRRAILKRG